MTAGSKPSFFAAAWRERQSRRLIYAWATPVLVTPPMLILICGLSVLDFAVSFALGLFGWSFIEYILHRWAMHFRPSERLDLWKLRERLLPHDEHHDLPDEPSIWIINQPKVSLQLALFAAILMWVVMPWPAAMATALGGAVGYLGYEWVHFATHFCRLEGRLGRFWTRHHLFHHYRDETVNFGVTTPIWDIVFGTYRWPRRAG